MVLLRQRPPTAKGTVFSTLEDEFGFMDLILHPQVFEEYRDLFIQNCFVIIAGRLQRDTNTISILVRTVEPLWDESEQPNKTLYVEPDQYFWS